MTTPKATNKHTKSPNKRQHTKTHTHGHRIKLENMAKTKEDNRKLLSCSFNFYVPKLIIFILVLFISINSDNGEKVHSKGGNGVSTVNVSTTSYQLFNGEATAIYADAPSGDIAIANKQNNHTGHGEGTTEAHYNFIVNENRDATRVDDADDADDADDSVGDGHRNTTSRRKNRSYNSNGERVLSRRRRYLIFPEGSSLQVGMYIYLSPLAYTSNAMFLYNSEDVI